MDWRIVPTGLAEAARALSGAKAPLTQTIAQATNTVGEESVNWLKREFRSAAAPTMFGGNWSATATAVRTGALRRSYGQRTTQQNDAVQLDVGVLAGMSEPIQYARLHEYGGTIKSSRAGGYLAIPLFGALTAAGVGRSASPRDFEGLFRIGNVLWMKAFKGPNSTKGGLIPMFLLRKQVTIRARPALGPKTVRHIGENLARKIGPAVAAALGARMRGTA